MVGSKSVGSGGTVISKSNLKVETKQTAKAGLAYAEEGKISVYQPYAYRYSSEFVEPDWRRLPGYKEVSDAEWYSAKWQKQHLVKSVADLKEVFGRNLSEQLAKSVEKDQSEHATMPLLIPPQMINTMNELDLENDPIRRYMIPAFSDRDPFWPSHPLASRDSLHEQEMWVVEGLTHRYPTKVLAEVLTTCPQYCGHCTRMDLVGTSVPSVTKRRFDLDQKERLELMLQYLRKNRAVRDVVVSGGDLANVPTRVLEEFVAKILEIENIRDIRMASKALVALPQHYLQDEVLTAYDRLAKKARSRGVSLAFHTHINSVSSVTPVVAKAARKLLELGFRDVRNQGVLLRGINDSPRRLLDLCFKLIDHAGITPYYFYLCDMVPKAEHWRTSVAQAQKIQHDIMGYLPGFSTPRIVCDVPYVGKRWVTQVNSYDRVKGISYWTKNYLTNIEANEPDKLTQLYEFYDPIHSLPIEGQQYWKDRAAKKQAKE